MSDNQDSAKKPNILLLFSDQHQAACTGYEGHPDVISPNLDDLARSGVRFKRAYCQSGICAPSRQSLMTGLYPRTLGVFDNEDHTSVQKEAIPLAQILQKNGYYTAAFGKRHLLGDNNDTGYGVYLDGSWDVSESHLSREDEYNYQTWLIEQGIDDTEGLGKGKSHIENYAHDWSISGRGPDGADGTPYGDFGKSYKAPAADLGTRTSHLSPSHTAEAWTAMRTMETIRDQKNYNKPFFIWSTFYHPHQPYTAQMEYLKMYDDKVKGYKKEWGEGLQNNSAIHKPANLEQDVSELTPMMKEWRIRENPIWNCGTAAKDHQIYRNYLAAYYALITEMDKVIGDIVNCLKEENKLDDTIIIYTSDHGEFAGRHGMVEKCAAGQHFYEDTYRVPLIISWPKHFKQDQVSESLVELIDIYPTLAEVLNIETSEFEHKLSGQSLLPVLKGEGELDRDYLVVESWSGYAVFGKEHKLVKWHEEDRCKSGKNPNAVFGEKLFDQAYADSENPALLLETEAQNHLGENDTFKAIQAELETAYQDWSRITSDIGTREILAKRL